MSFRQGASLLRGPLTPESLGQRRVAAGESGPVIVVGFIDFDTEITCPVRGG
jgi:formate-dependent phosphoribosylglycinamide formyltransferase (GAR transformylase)